MFPSSLDVTNMSQEDSLPNSSWFRWKASLLSTSCFQCEAMDEMIFECYWSSCDVMFTLDEVSCSYIT